MHASQCCVVPHGGPECCLPMCISSGLLYMLDVFKNHISICLKTYIYIYINMSLLAGTLSPVKNYEVASVKAFRGKLTLPSPLILLIKYQYFN